MAFYKSALFKRMTGDNPIVLVDVGARGGLDAKWQPVKESLKIIGFEPDEKECRGLNAAAGSRRVYYPIGLAGKKGLKTLYLTRNGDCASIIEPDAGLLNRFQSSEDFNVTGKIEIQCDTLDNITAANDIKTIDFIKVDTQGSELEILRGAEKTLDQAGIFGVEVEAEFSSLYKDQPLFADIDVFLRDKGFTLFDIRTPPGRKTRKTAPPGSREWAGQALWTDALYFKDLIALKSGFMEKTTREGAVKAIAIAELYGFGDFSLELLELYVNHKIITPAESEEILKAILSGIAGGVKPELKLLQDFKSGIGAYTQKRLPPLHRLITHNQEK